jgi:hypothetical protein
MCTDIYSLVEEPSWSLPISLQTLANEEFIAKFMKARESSDSGGLGHTYGPDGHLRMSKHMVRKIIMKMHS